jgi:hypothetical protein
VTATSTPCCSALPASSTWTRCSWRAAPRRSGARVAYGLPDDGLDPVDRIVGPGSAWVTAAKIEVVGEVGIDLPAGPSEGLVLADATAHPPAVAADLITQAEHGPDSPALLVTMMRRSPMPSRPRSDPARDRARRDILERALAEHGRIVLVRDLAQGIDFVNDYGPEHLSVDVEPLEGDGRPDPQCRVPLRRPWAPESAGDYATGANHVLPTGGLARSSGGLDVEITASTTRSSGSPGRPRGAPAGDRHARRGRGPAGPSRRGGGPLRRRGGGTMSPSPFAVTSPTDPASYSWEATDEQRGRALRHPGGRGHALRPQHLPHPAGDAAELLAEGRFETRLSEYPPGDYRRLVEAAAERYGVTTDEIVSAPAPTRSSTCAPRRSCPGAGPP